MTAELTNPNPVIQLLRQTVNVWPLFSSLAPNTMTDLDAIDSALWPGRYFALYFSLPGCDAETRDRWQHALLRTAHALCAEWATRLRTADPKRRFLLETALGLDWKPDLWTSVHASTMKEEDAKTVRVASSDAVAWTIALAPLLSYPWDSRIGPRFLSYLQTLGIASVEAATATADADVGADAKQSDLYLAQMAAQERLALRARFLATTTAAATTSASPGTASLDSSSPIMSTCPPVSPPPAPPPPPELANKQSAAVALSATTLAVVVPVALTTLVYAIRN